MSAGMYVRAAIPENQAGIKRRTAKPGLDSATRPQPQALLHKDTSPVEDVQKARCRRGARRLRRRPRHLPGALDQRRRPGLVMRTSTAEQLTGDECYDHRTSLTRV